MENKQYSNPWVSLMKLTAMVVAQDIGGLPTTESGMIHFMRKKGVYENQALFRKTRDGKQYHTDILKEYAIPTSNEWLSVGRMLEADLPNMPRSSGSFSEYIRKHGWRADRQFFRERRSNGGGYEYHVSLLPEKARTAWHEFCDRGVPFPPDPDVDTRSQQPKEQGKEPTTLASTDLSSVRNSDLLAELLMRMFRALGDDHG